MKTLILAAGWLATTSAVLAGIPVGRGEVTASIDATAIYDSNVFGTHDATADFSGTLAPRLSYRRQAGQIEAEANAGISFIRYLDQTQLNADNLAIDGTLRFAESDLRNYSGFLSAAYVEASDISTDLNARINTKTTTLTGHAALVAGPRTDVTLDGNYADTLRSLGSNQQLLTTEAVYAYKDFFYGNTLRLTGEYTTLQSSGDNAIGVPLDQNSTTFSAGLERALGDTALRARIGYGYRVLNRSAAETQGGPTRQGGSVITASLDGPFLPEKYFPKITSQFTLAYEDSATPGINDTGSKGLTGSLNLAWQARQNTKVSFTAQRSQQLSANDLSIVSSGVQLTLDQTLRYNLTGSLSAGYNWSSYRATARNDRTATVSAGLKYHFAGSWDASLAYTLNSTTSTVRQSTFDRHVVSLGLTYRF